MTDRILRLLKANPGGLGLQALFRGLGSPTREKLAIKARLRELEERGLILRVRRRYVFMPQFRLLRGRVVKATDRFVFVRPEQEGAEDIFVPARYARQAMLGDTVELAGGVRDQRAGPEGRIVRILDRRRNTLLGSLQVLGGRAHVRPFEVPGSEDLPLTITTPLETNPGTILEVDRETLRIVRVLGKPEDTGVDLSVVIRKYDLPEAFSPEALSEAEEAAAAGWGSQGFREDLRDWSTVTIDGDDARDFDDAVSIRVQDGGRCLLGVHIADVSHYVRAGSQLDREARRRGTSVYFPERALPMLPEILSHHACSLNPGEDRPAVSMMLVVGEDGAVLDARAGLSVIRSDARLTYDQVLRILTSGGRDNRDPRIAAEDLMAMRTLAARMRLRRAAAGSLDFSHPEPRLIYEGGNLTAVEPFVPHEAHGIIEEFMLAANEAVAAFLDRRGIPMIYRVHPPPSLRDLSELRSLLEHFGYALPPARSIRSRDLQAVQSRAAASEAGRFISLQVLKSLKLAAYDSRNQGHYGLGKDLYTHFTSPIRRYPDLIVHRILKRELSGLPPRAMPLSAWARACSELERRAEDAENDLVEWRIYRYLHSRLGDEFEGFVSAITKAGLTVELDDLFVTGIVLFQDLGGEYFVRDGELSLRGRESGRRIFLGDRVRVVLASVDPERRSMILVPSPVF